MAKHWTVQDDQLKLMNFNPFGLGTYPVAPPEPEANPRPARNTYHNRPMRNMNDLKQDEWEYREENYHTEKAAEMRMNSMADSLRRTLVQRGLFIAADPEEMEKDLAWDLPPPQHHSGDGSRWDEL